MSPECNEKIHGDEHEFPEEEEEKKIDGDKNADNPRQGGHQVEMEKPRHRVSISVHDESTAVTPRKTVRRTSRRLSPSMAR